MARTIPVCPSPPDAKGIQKCLSYEIALVTPMFGGGVDKGENDPLTPVRGTAIRGHLRFWWRATRGARFSTFEELKKVEDEIWGCTEKRGIVSLQVEIIEQGRSQPCASIPPGRRFHEFITDHPGYVLFPFAGMGTEAKSGRNGLKFTLKIRLSKDSAEKDVSAALWAWINFGGLGARTRRGCGALFCKELAPNGNSIKDWYGKKLSEFEIKPGSAREWPTIPGVDGLLFNPSQAVPMKAWNQGASILKNFRQGKNVGRNPGSNPNPAILGRSRWPEPDSIRSATGRSASKHSQKVTPVQYYPRAEFGMPIVFHFKDGGDPQDCELLPGKDLARMASPIIIKPLAMDNQKAYSILLKLVTIKLSEIRLEDSKFRKTITVISGNQISNNAVTTYPNSPMTGTQAPYSALDAFMNFARKEGYR